MNILHLNNQARFQGGVEQMLLDTARSLSKLGYRQGLLYRESESDPAYLAPFSWSGRDLPSAQAAFDPDVIIIHKFDDSRVLNMVTARYDTLFYVHDHDLVCPRRHKYLPVSGQICESPAGMNCVTNLCVVERAAPGAVIPVSVMQGFKRQRALIASTRSCSAFAVGSRWMRDSLIANGIPGDKIAIVPPVPATATPCRQPRPARDRLLFVGQLVRGKGVDLLIRAMDRVESDCELTIIGDGNHRAQCEALTRDLGLENRISFKGYVPHDMLCDYYAGATVVAVPSRWPEPFGMVGLEAMSRGKPVVAFASGGINDWLVHQETGLLAETGDVRRFAHNIDTLLRDKAAYARMSAAAVARVREHYTHDQFIDRLLGALPVSPKTGVIAS